MVCLLQEWVLIKLQVTFRTIVYSLAAMDEMIHCLYCSKKKNILRVFLHYHRIQSQIFTNKSSTLNMSSVYISKTYFLLWLKYL